VRIIKFSAENVKKLKAVEISPTGDIVEVTGPNGSGKSSVLDAIFYALAGTAEIPSAVVRQGQESAVVKLDLGELVVTRKFTAKGGTTLTVEAASGARFPSPQKMLDELIGALSFDPLAFIRMKPTEQLNALRSVVKLDVDLDVLDATTKRYFEARTSTNREIKSLEARLTALPAPPTDTPVESIDVAELTSKLQAAYAGNAAIESDRRDREQLALKVQDDLRNADQKANTIIETNAEAQRRIDAVTVQRDRTIGELQKIEQELRQRAKENDLKLKALMPLPWPVDTAGFVAQINTATEVNKNVARLYARQKLQDDIALQKQKSLDESGTIEANNRVRAETIAAAKMPVDGLSFGDGEVTYQGLPLANASSGEQLRVSVALAMAVNPKLRILRVKDGSLLDETSLKLLADMASAADYQVWLERVESTDRPCVVMEDGAIHGEDDWDVKVVKKVLTDGPVRVDLGKVSQSEVAHEREKLHATILRVTAEPVEIITGADPDGNVHLTVRRFV